MAERRASHNSRQRNGFTIVEVLMMLAVIAVLVGVMVPSLNGRIRDAQVTSLKGGLENVQAAIVAFRSDMTVYPSNLWELQTYPLGGTESCGGGMGSLEENWRGPYISLDIVDVTNSPPLEVGLTGGDWVMSDLLVRTPTTSSATVPQARLQIQVQDVPIKDATLLNTLVDGPSSTVPPLSSGQDTAGSVRWGAIAGGVTDVTYGFVIRGC